MKEQCIFCNYDPEALIYKGDDGYVIVDWPCRPGHVLVEIEKHYPNLHDVPDEQISKMMKLAAKTSKAIIDLTNAEKTYVVAIGDKDKHFHVHLIPKMKDDPALGPHIFGETNWASFLPTEIDKSEISEINSKIFNLLKQG